MNRSNLYDVAYLIKFVNKRLSEKEMISVVDELNKDSMLQKIVMGIMIDQEQGESVDGPLEEFLIKSKNDFRHKLEKMISLNDHKGDQIEAEDCNYSFEEEFGTSVDEGLPENQMDTLLAFENEEDVLFKLEDYNSEDKEYTLKENTTNTLSQERIDFISAFNTKLLKQRTLKDAYAFICDTIRKELSCRSTSIFLYSREGNLERKYISGFDEGVEPESEIFEIGQGFVGKAIGSRDVYGQLQSCNSLEELVKKEGDPRLNSYMANIQNAIYRQYGQKEPLQHIIVVPLNSFRRSAGVIRAINKNEPSSDKMDLDGFNEQDKAQLQLITALSTNTISFLKLEIRNQVLSEIPLMLNRYDQHTVFDKIASSLINEATLYDTCIIRIVDSRNRYLEIRGTSKKDMDPLKYRIKVEEGITGTTFYSDSHQIVEDLRKDKKNFLYPRWAKENGMVTMICFPLKSANGLINYGTISVYTKFKFEFGLEDIQYLKRFANMVSGVIESIEDEKEQNFLMGITNKLIAGHDLEEVMLETARALPQITGFDKCRFLLKEKNCFRIITRRKDPPKAFQVSFDNAVIRHVLSNPTKILKFPDVEQETFLNDVRPLLDNVRSMVLIPVANARQDVYGAIVLVSLISKQVHVVKKRQVKVIHNLLTKLNENLLFTICNFFATDIEKMKEKEEKEKISERLIEEQHLLRTLVDNIPDLVYVKDSEHRFQLVNKAQARILGASSTEEAIGRTDLDFHKTKEALGFHNKEKQLFTGEKDSIDIEETVHNREGETKIISTTKVTYRDRAGQIIGLVGIGRDISELKRKEHVLEETIQELEQAKKNAENAVHVIKSQYQDFKDSVGILTDKLINETDTTSKLHLYARIIAAEFFVERELFAKYLSRQSLRPKHLANMNLGSVFDKGFEKLIKLTPKMLGENTAVVLKIDNGDKVFRFDKKQIQDIVLSLVVNALKHQITGENSTIYIETIGQYIYVKNDCRESPHDLNRLKKIITSLEYNQEGSTLFAIDKYFKENYKADINIDYRDDQFIVELPVLSDN